MDETTVRAELPEVYGHEEPMMPDGYQDGDTLEGLIATLTAADDGETQNAGEGEQPDAAPDSGTEATDGTPVEGQPDTPEETTPEAPQHRVLKLRDQHQDVEFDVDGASDEDLTRMYQQSKAYERLKAKETEKQYRDVFQQQLDRGMTEDVARLVAAKAAGRDYPLPDEAVDNDDEDGGETPAARPGGGLDRDAFMRGIRQVQTLYPDFKEMPADVVRLVEGGADVLTAYSAYRTQAAQQEIAKLAQENATLKAQAETAQRAPVKGVTGGGSAKPKAPDPFLKGFDADY